MGWPDAIVSGLAALLGAGVGGGATIWATKKTLNSDEVAQRNQILADSLLSKEEREHQQRREAYAPIITHVLRTAYVIGVRTAVANRRYVAVDSAREASKREGLINAAAATAQLTAFEGAEPTQWEQETINAGPTRKDTLETLGLARTFATSEVLREFRKVVDSAETIEIASVRLDDLLRDYPTPLKTEFTDDELDDPDFDMSGPARRLIQASSDASEVIFKMRDATKSFGTAGASVLKTIDLELDQYRRLNHSARSLSF